MSKITPFIFFLSFCLYPFMGLAQNKDATPFYPRLVEVEKGYSGTSVNTEAFRRNSLVTHSNKQYIAFYDDNGYLTLGRRTLDYDTWEVNHTPYRGHVEDAHNAISLMVDGDGFLHVAFDEHDDSLHYCRSIAPESLALSPQEPMIGVDEAKVSYPEFYSLPSGNLLFVYRSGMSGQGNMVMNYYDTQSRTWHRLHDVLIDGEGQRSAYWQLAVDDNGIIHLSWVWRETPLVETNHDLCYARSYDDGKTWCKTDGTLYNLPIRLDNAEYACHIPQGSDLINQTSMCVDSLGDPYIATYWRDQYSKIPQYRLVWHDGLEWHSSQVAHRRTPFTLGGGGTKLLPIARPQIVIDGDEAFYIFRDEERGNKASMFYASELSKRDWRVIDLTDYSLEAWEPTIDTELLKQQKKLHLFVQKVLQGDGERSVDVAPQMVGVLEIKTQASRASSAYSVAEVENIIHKVNDHWQVTHSAEVSPFWDNAAYHTGNMEAFFLTGDFTYYDYSRSWAEFNDWKGAKSDNPRNWKYTYGETDDYVLFGDYQACFQTYIDLYNLSPDEKKIARARQVMEYEMSTKHDDYWWWADALYMVMPVMVKLYNVTHNSLYLEKLHDYWHYADSIMYDPESHLYYRDDTQIYPKHKTPNGKKDFWARGNGWVLAALTKVLKELPQEAPFRGEYLERYLAMAEAVASAQAQGGYWTCSMTDTAFVPGPETSGTAFFTYALLWGINNGYLDKSRFVPVVMKAWDYLSNVALEADGSVGYVQPIGDRAVEGQVLDASYTANFGVGAFLLAACEMARFLQEEDAYLFVYFTGNRIEQEAVCYAVSTDGYTYRQLNNGKPVLNSKEISSTGGVRDPHILRCEDGKTFYMVLTDMVSGNGWDSNRAMVLLKSTDLIHWTHSVINIQERYPNQEDLKRVWAPQTIYDPEAEKYMVYWSMKHGESGEDTIYYAYANDSFTDLVGEPKPLFLPKDGKSCIDGDIVYKDGVYHLFYKTEGHGNGIKVATTRSLTSCQWEETPDYKQQTSEDVEGAGTFKLIGQDKYILMYDVYKKHTYQFTETTDLEHFSVIDNEIDMDFHPRHGTIIPITREEYFRLTSYWK